MNIYWTRSDWLIGRQKSSYAQRSIEIEKEIKKMKEKKKAKKEFFFAIHRSISQSVPALSIGIIKIISIPFSFQHFRRYHTFSLFPFITFTSVHLRIPWPEIHPFSQALRFMQGQYFVVVVAFSSMSRSAMWNKSHKTGSFIFQMTANRRLDTLLIRIATKQQYKWWKE